MALDGSVALNGKRPTGRRTHVTPASIMVPRLVLIGAVLLLVIIGLVMVYSASSIEGYAEFQDAAHFFKRQCMLLVIGLGVGALFALFPYQKWRGLPIWIFWGVIVALLLFTTVFGYVGLGSKRWLYIFGQGFQPSEFAKIAMLMLAAHLFVLQRTGNYPKTFRRFTLTMILVTFIPAIIIFVQPDLGTFLIAVFGIFAVMWFGEVPWKAVLLIIMAVVVIGILAITLESFRSDRIAAWLNPWSDPLGTGYQVINSFYAFSDGGIFGVGLGNSLQKYLYLPEAYNDFIFAIIGEETGLFGCTVIIFLFMAIFAASLRIGQSARDEFGAVLAPSCGALLLFQALLNICCVTGLFPITGKPLPFISYGGTSLWTSLMLVGIILSVSLHAETESYEQRRDRLLVTMGGAPFPDGGMRSVNNPARSSRSTNMTERSARSRVSSTNDSKKTTSLQSTTSKPRAQRAERQRAHEQEFSGNTSSRRRSSSQERPSVRLTDGKQGAGEARATRGRAGETHVDREYRGEKDGRRNRSGSRLPRQEVQEEKQGKAKRRNRP
jgi:cell division protein FtsW